MKKTTKALLTMFSLAFVILMAMGTTSKAAGWNAGLKQTKAEESRVTIQWDNYIGEQTVGHYEIEYSLDGTTFGRTGDSNYSTGTSYDIRNLNADKEYFVRVTAYTGSFYSDSKAPIAVSETIKVATLGKVAKVENLVQTAATENSLSMSWKAVEGASSYTVYVSNGLYDYLTVLNTTQTSCTITNLPTGFAANFFVMAKKVTFNGFEAMADLEYAGHFERVTMKTTPAKVQSMIVSNYWNSLNECQFQWSKVNNADGYQLQTKNGKGKVIANVNTTSTSAAVSPFKKGQFHATRVRAYVKVGNGFAYGPWSSYRYDASNKSVKWTRSANRKKITLKWKKITGIDSYRVYISTKRDSGYKKVKTLGKKSKGCTITKCGKKKLSKKKTYYVKVEYIKKVGKKKVKSGIVSLGTVY